jgi:hypothetical protein
MQIRVLLRLISVLTVFFWLVTAFCVFEIAKECLI